MDNRPFIDVDILGHSLVALLDSGANQYSIGEQGLKILTGIQNLIKPSSSLSVTTADGSIQSCLGTVYLPLTINNYTKTLNILIVPSIKHALILGTDFCQTFELTMNLKNSSWSTPFCSSINVIKDASSLGEIEKEQL